MKCPKCGGKYKVYSTKSYNTEDDKTVVQYRTCEDCGYSGKTTYQKWVCESDPSDYQ